MTDTLADYAAEGTANLQQPRNLLALADIATLAALLLRMCSACCGAVGRAARPTKCWCGGSPLALLVALALVLTAREIPASRRWSASPAIARGDRGIALACTGADRGDEAARGYLGRGQSAARRQRTKLTMLRRTPLSSSS